MQRHARTPMPPLTPVSTTHTSFHTPHPTPRSNDGKVNLKMVAEFVQKAKEAQRPTVLHLGTGYFVVDAHTELYHSVQVSGVPKETDSVDG
jgi:hypothetical protein